MTKEDKQLLLIDLCVRLPYGVRVKIFDESILLYEHNENGTLDGKEIMSDDCFVIKGKNDSWIISCEDFKPYLRPMSSMTDEEREEYCYLQDKFLYSSQYPVTNAFELFDWLNKNMFDYRELIPMGLALEAKEGMYKNK